MPFDNLEHIFIIIVFIFHLLYIMQFIDQTSLICSCTQIVFVSLTFFFFFSQIFGCEVDLLKFSELISMEGGFKAVRAKKKWPKMADQLNIPRSVSIAL